jgi:hypothetical protein
MGNLSCLVLLLLLSSCGSKIPFVETPALIKVETLEGVLKGEMKLADGKNLNLDNLREKPYILIIAGETCETCLEEAHHLKEIFTEQGGIPKNVDIYTLVLGGFIEDAEFWAQNIGIQWSYGVDLNQDQIFKSYCTGFTPCVLAVNTKLNTYTRFVGSSSFDDWQKETLTWEY